MMPEMGAEVDTRATWFWCPTGGVGRFTYRRLGGVPNGIAGTPSRRMVAETCLSGRKEPPAKRLGGVELPPGFESRRLRRERCHVPEPRPGRGGGFGTIPVGKPHREQDGKEWTT
jgi:hypothetical protein